MSMSNSRSIRASVHTRGKWEVTPEDTTVVALGAAAATASWWTHLIDWIPVIVQIGITSATLIFVSFRAAHEVRKFWRDRKDESDK